MANLPRYGEPDGDAERRRYAGIVAQVFAGDVDAFSTWILGFGPDVRLLRDGDVQAGLVFYRMGQFFGGRSVPTWGVAGVGVKPELRSKGMARELMSAMLQENFEHGAPLSTLYPAAPKLYRNLGWEFAGSRCAYAARLSELPHGDGSLLVRPVDDSAQELLADLYRRRRVGENGCLDRIDRIWERVKRAPRETPLCAYVVERDGVPEGYTLYIQKREPGVVFRYDMHARDLVCLTRDAARELLGFFARNRSVANHLYFYAAPQDPLLIELQLNQEVRVHERQDWMLRIVRVPDALQQRGYSAHVKTEAQVTIDDPALPDNSGDWTLQLSDGRMQVERGGRGGPRLHVRGLAALYSGSLAPAQLRNAGLLTGADQHDAALQAMFAGTTPWMPDFF